MFAPFSSHLHHPYLIFSTFPFVSHLLCLHLILLYFLQHVHLHYQISLLFILLLFLFPLLFLLLFLLLFSSIQLLLLLLLFHHHHLLLLLLLHHLLHSHCSCSSDLTGWQYLLRPRLLWQQHFMRWQRSPKTTAAAARSFPLVYSVKLIYILRGWRAA